MAHLLSPCIVRDTTRRPGGDAEAPPTGRTRGVLLRFCQEHPPTCAPHRLLGPCFKTGRGRPCHAKPGCPLHRTPSGGRPAREDHHQCGAVVAHQSPHHTRHPGPARPKTHRTRHMQPRVNKNQRARQGGPGVQSKRAGCGAHHTKCSPGPPLCVPRAEAARRLSAARYHTLGPKQAVCHRVPPRFVLSQGKGLCDRPRAGPRSLGRVWRPIPSAR